MSGFCSKGEFAKMNDSTFDNETLRVEILVSASRGASPGDSLSFTIATDTMGTGATYQDISTETLTVAQANTSSTQVREVCVLVHMEEIPVAQNGYRPH